MMLCSWCLCVQSRRRQGLTRTQICHLSPQHLKVHSSEFFILDIYFSKVGIVFEFFNESDVIFLDLYKKIV